jgi:hypothetical protein
MNTGINPPSNPANAGSGSRERSLKWIIAAGLVGLFWVIGVMVGRFVSLFQGLDVPLPLWSRLLIGYGPEAIPLFGAVAAAAWVLSDVYFRGRWIQWFLFAFFAFVIFGIFVALVVPMFRLLD